MQQNELKFKMDFIKLNNEKISEIYDETTEIIANLLDSEQSKLINIPVKIKVTVNELIKIEIEKILNNREDLVFASKEDTDKYVLQCIEENKRSFEAEIKRRNE